LVKYKSSCWSSMRPVGRLMAYDAFLQFNDSLSTFS
jgi:hypothetical protein